ncbi:insulinase family protein [bacterium]|nr:insulinase family protein [candidate division CSSED10-310 bacterium]
MDVHNPSIGVGSILNGFRVLRQEPIDALQLVFYELEHQAIGSRLIHLSSNDDNCVFMITLATHPENSTGVAHILEHGVLEGSKKYPVKIFKNLSGRSLNTFLNAMTSSDYTAYPFASRNRIDFFNLMDVYLDAVFFPLLEKETFLQEGWRYEFSPIDDPCSPLEYKGVVFNEMKGAMGNPVRLYYEYSRKAVFPDLTYAYASGGHPRHMPELTYDEWKAFHARFYHPSNAIFFSYGDVSLSDVTANIHSHVLSHVQPSTRAAKIPVQKPYPQPQRMRFTFPVSKSEDPKNKAFVAVLWKLLPVTAFYENLSFSLLNTILCSSSASLLNRVLLESGLGGGLVPGGFETGFSETVFGAGLKDTNEENADAIEALILDTLKTVCREGFEQSDIDAAIHELEFSSREISGDGGIPFGMTLALQGMELYLHGGDFSAALKINEVLDRLRTDSAKPAFFPDLIERYLLNNPHRITMIVAPDVGGMEDQETMRRAQLDAVRNAMSQDDAAAVIAQSRKLLEHQKREGNTDCLPQIAIEDISEDPDRIPQEIKLYNGRAIYRHPITTNGISYALVTFDRPFSDAVPIQGIRYIGLLPELGAGGRGYVEMSRLIRERTGGISVDVSGARHVQTGQNRLTFTISGRCLPRNHAAMFELIRDVLCEPDLTQTSRIAELLNMQKAYAIPRASFRGHLMAALAAGRYFSPLRWINHEISGMGGIRSLIQLAPDNVDSIAATMQNLLQSMLSREWIHIGLTGLSDQMDDMTPLIDTVLSRLPETAGPYSDTNPVEACPEPRPEAWIISTDVSYVVRVYPTVPFEHPDSAAFSVLSALMEMPLYERIRAQGGAYGAFASHDSTSALFQLMTYRDPHTAQSLDHFDEVIKQMANGDFTNEKLKQAKINVISRLDTPPSPREKGMIEFFRALNGMSDDLRTGFRRNLLHATRDDIVRIVSHFLVDTAKSNVAIVTSDGILNNDETRPLNLTRETIE